MPTAPPRIQPTAVSPATRASAARRLGAFTADPSGGPSRSARRASRLGVLRASGLILAAAVKRYHVTQVVAQFHTPSRDRRVYRRLPRGAIQRTDWPVIAA